MMGAPASLGDRFDAIVIGASAGGTEALSRLLPALPSRMRATVLVVLHLPRERPSLLTALFSGRCAVPVSEAQDKEQAAQGALYFAPPDYHLLVEHGPSLALSVDDAVCFSRPSIDVLFESAADVYGERLLAIVLTGANDDGSRGLLTVCKAGGTAIVQDPAEAVSPMMPAQALRRCPQAFSLPLGRIAQLLSTLDVEGST
jgi:two-component system, chemotaxis family, protein-glutamate methylesterase/glutaminase